MNESKAMLEIRKIRELEDKKMRKMSATDMFEYMKTRFKKSEKLSKNSNSEKNVNYNIPLTDSVDGILIENSAKYNVDDKEK